MNYLMLSILALPLVASPIVYLIGRISVRKNALWGMGLAKILSLLVLLAEMVLVGFGLKTAMAEGSLSMYVGETLMVFDTIGLLVSAVALVLGACSVLFSFRYIRGEKGEEKFYALLLITIGCIIGLAYSYDLFTMWIWFEGMAVSTYLLVAFYNDQAESLEAGFKYLVQSAIGSALVLLGIAIIFSVTGSTSFQYIWYLDTSAGAFTVIGGILLIVGFGVKASLVPLHTWLPDAHSQAPSGISAMLSGVVISAGLVALLRAISPFIILTPMWTFIILGFGALNILAGNLMALRQTQVKRLLAYSSLAHIGYMLIGIGVTLGTGDPTGAQGGFFHLVTHMLMKGLAFLAVGALLYVLYVAKGHHGPLVVEDLNGAARRYPIVALTLSIAVLGLGGLPPLAGFMSKWQIFVSGFQTQNVWVIVLVIFAGINSVLSLGYYAPLVNRLYRLEPSQMVKEGRPASLWLQAPLIILALAIVVLGVWPTLLSWLYTPAAEAFIQGILPW